MMVHRITPRRSAAPWIAFLLGVAFAVMAALGVWVVQTRGAEERAQRFTLAPPGIDMPAIPRPSPTPPAPT